MNADTSGHLFAGQPRGDQVLAAAFMALTSVEIWVLSLGDGYGLGLRIAATVTTLIASAALAMRSTRPTACFWVNGAAVIATIALGYPSDIYQWSNLIAAYSIGAHGTNLHRWSALPVAVASVGFYFVRFPAEGGAAVAGFVAALWVVAWLAGRIYGARREEMVLRHERDLSRRLAEANEERLALEEERNRIARELHDIIGHTVNVMVVHAGAGRGELERDVDRARKAFDTIEQTGRTALSELDRVLAVLRGDEADQRLDPTPGIGELAPLAARFTDAGLKMDLEISGDASEVPASVSLSTYRIVQEAVTNTMRHANASRAAVEVDIGTGKLDIRVVDDGEADPDRIHAGRGITGMRERAALHRGEISLQRNGDRGLAVIANLAWEPES